MSIYDCFIYFDEEIVLDLRFNILDKFVDKFIIVEATIDHAGKEKKINFNINRYPKFKHKIYHYIVEDIPINVSNFKKNWSTNFVRENFHRNAIQRCLINCKKNDLIIISDADEIPNLQILNEVKIKKYALFKQLGFMYKLNLLSNDSWLGSGISYYKNLKSPQWLRNKRFLRRGFLKNIFFKTQLIENGGWHFSFLKKPKGILTKLNSYAHGEIKNYTIQEIEKNIENQKIFFLEGDKNRLKKVAIDEKYPSYIRENISSFKDWLV